MGRGQGGERRDTHTHTQEHTHTHTHTEERTCECCTYPLASYPCDPDCLVQPPNSRIPPKSIGEGASSPFGVWPGSPENVSCSRATPRLHRCKSGVALEQETFSGLPGHTPERPLAPSPIDLGGIREFGGCTRQSGSQSYPLKSARDMLMGLFLYLCRCEWHTLSQHRRKSVPHAGCAACKKLWEAQGQSIALNCDGCDYSCDTLWRAASLAVPSPLR